MKATALHHLKRRKGVDMEHIDVHDLPEADAQLIAAFVELLRRWRSKQAEPNADAQEEDWAAAAVTSFAKDWDNDEDAIYDNWKEHYHVSQR